MATTTYYTDTQGRTVIEARQNSELDYTFDWSAWLAKASDTLYTAVAIPASGLDLIGTPVHGAGMLPVMARVTGTPGSLLKLKCSIVTNSVPPRKTSDEIYIKVI